MLECVYKHVGADGVTSPACQAWRASLVRQPRSDTDLRASACARETLMWITMRAAAVKQTVLATLVFRCSFAYLPGHKQLFGDTDGEKARPHAGPFASVRLINRINWWSQLTGSRISTAAPWRILRTTWSHQPPRGNRTPALGFWDSRFYAGRHRRLARADPRLILYLNTGSALAMSARARGVVWLGRRRMT